MLVFKFNYIFAHMFAGWVKADARCFLDWAMTHFDVSFGVQLKTRHCEIA